MGNQKLKENVNITSIHPEKAIIKLPKVPKFLILSDEQKVENYILCTEPLTIYWISSKNPLKLVHIRGVNKKEQLQQCLDWYNSSNKDEILNSSIKDQGFSLRCENALADANIKTIRDLCYYTLTELKAIKGFGARCWSEIEIFLDQMELSLRKEPI